MDEERKRSQRRGKVNGRQKMLLGRYRSNVSVPWLTSKDQGQLRSRRDIYLEGEILYEGDSAADLWSRGCHAPLRAPTMIWEHVIQAEDPYNRRHSGLYTVDPRYLRPAYCVFRLVDPLCDFGGLELRILTCQISYQLNLERNVSVACEMPFSELLKDGA